MLRSVLAAAISIGFCQGASAWGQIGHRVTGAIADKYLSDAARAAIRDILGPAEGLAEASTWPDFMRSSNEPFWKNEAPPLHYVTVPHGKTYAEVGAPPEGDAVTALKRFENILKNPGASIYDKRVALRFTVHIIGDLHQPLHNGNGIDHGGNDVRVKFFGADTNLHAIWDEGLIGRENLSYTEWTAWLSAKITDDMARRWADPDPIAWIAESTAIRDGVYPTGDNLSFRYHFEHIGTVREQLQKGGVRIAAYLNHLFAR
jgi:S1/P1 Nuclease